MAGRIALAALLAAGCALTLGCAFPAYSFVDDGGAGAEDTSIDGAADSSPPRDTSGADVEADAATRETGADASADTSVDSTAPDTTALPDTTVTSLTCERIGVTCPGDRPYCALKVVSSKWSSTCVATPGTLAFNDACNPIDGGCADGFNCGVVYPKSAPFFRCVPLCSDSADCPASYPFCNWSLDGLAPGRMCGMCDPTRDMGPDCPAGESCVVQTKSIPPICHGVGGNVEGSKCLTWGDCVAGLTCVCEKSGESAIGDICSSLGAVAVCRRACLPYLAGSKANCVAGQLCTLVTGSDYAYCR